jgi:hypothetical protein
MCVRFTLSLRTMENLLFKRGIDCAQDCADALRVSHDLLADRLSYDLHRIGRLMRVHDRRPSDGVVACPKATA